MTSGNLRGVGRYTWNSTTGRWTWDAGMFELHGYRDGAVDVSSDLVLSHKQEEHRARARAIFEASAAEDHLFSNYHGIVDTNGRERTVLTVGASTAKPSGSCATHRYSRGFMVDVTQSEDRSVSRALERARRNSAPIQQSQGLLMGSLGLTADAAFAVMARVSQSHNVPVRELAPRFIAAATASAPNSPRELSQLLIDQATTLAAGRGQTTT